MTASDIRQALLARPNTVLILFYAAVRAVLLAVGVRFDIRNLTDWMQIADVALLRHDLANTLLYLHTQPPLFNLIVGLALKCGDAAFPWVMDLLFAAVTLAGILAFHDLARDLGRRPGIALILSAWLCVAPGVILFSTKLYYDGLVPWLVVLSLWGLHRGQIAGSWRHYLFGFAVFAAILLMRTQFHWLLFPMLVAIALWGGRGQARMIAATAAAPIALVIAVIAKNFVLFGITGLTSWAPLNPNQMTTDRLPPATREAMIANGTISPLARIPSYSDPATYIAALGPPPHTGQPSLDNVFKSTGGPNWNNAIYIKVGQQRGGNFIPALLTGETGYTIRLVTSAYHFHRPSSEFKGLEANLARIAPWERLANAVVGLQPAAWFGGSLDPRRPQAVILQPAYSELLVTAAFAGALFTMIAIGVRRIIGRTRPDAEETLMGGIVLTGGFVTIVSTMLDVWENNRAHYDIAPVLLLGALWFVARHIRPARPFGSDSDTRRSG